MTLWLSFKRVASKGAVWVMALILAACILLCGTLSEDDGIPGCGIVSGNDTIALDIAEKLCDDGLVRYESEDELINAIQRGEVASGIVLPCDLTARMQSVNLNGAIKFYESEQIMFAPIYKFRLTAYMLEHYAPYLTSELLQKEGAELSPDEVRAGIDEYLADEVRFNFTFENAESVPLKTEHYSLNLTMGVLSLFLFFAFGLFAVPYTEEQLLPLARRVGAKKALSTYSLGSVISAVALFFFAAVASLLLSDKLFSSGAADLIPPAGIYIIFLSALGIAVTAIFGSTEKVRVPIIAICLVSLAVCPIFINISDFIGIPAWIKHFVPTYFFYTARDNPAVCTSVAATVFSAACALYTVRIVRKVHIQS